MTEDYEEERSEFGKGLTYCLGLFLCHSDRDWWKPKDLAFKETWMWFNGAGDHLFDMVIPNTLPQSLRARIGEFRIKVLTWRLHDATEEDKTWAINEAKQLLLLIDRELGVDAERGQWE